MKSALSIIPALLLIVLSTSHPAYSWDCSVDLVGPTWVKIGRSIDLTASGLPAGGQYYWSATSNLVPNGSTATLTGFKPAYSDYIRVGVRYTTPKGHSCSDVKWVYAHLGDCQIALDAVSFAPVGEPTLFTATVQPDGGSCSWLSPSGILDQGLTAQFTAQTPGLQTFEAEYITSSGDNCPASHETTFYKVDSIASPYTCVNSGTVLEKGSFVIASDPPGYLDASSSQLTISPLILHTFSQSSTETITASITPASTLDDATTMLKVVNPDIKTSIGTNIDIKIPDYISNTLSKIGLADKAKLNITNSLSNKLNCCGYSRIEEGRELKFSVELGAEAGPFTIIGVPLSPSVKDYVSLDLLNLTLSGKGEVAVTADHDPCARHTDFSGGGEITATAGLGGELTLKYSSVLVVEFHVGGKTSISEKFTPSNGKLYASASWGGLTASVDGEIRIFGGPPLELTPKSKNYFKEDNILPF